MIVFDEHDNMHEINIQDATCVRKEDKTRKIIVTTPKGRFYFPSTLQHLNIWLSTLGFFQIDKNKIINVSKINKYKNGEIRIGMCAYTVSRRNRKEFEQLIENRSRHTNG